jgi:hypothetical protein
MTKEDNFYQCSCCKHKWSDIDSFLGDCDVRLVGYQVHFKELEVGFFYFNHSCGTTLGLPVSVFTHLYNGPIFTERLTGTEACPGHCIHENNLKPCPLKCECASIREIMQVIKNYKKH